MERDEDGRDVDPDALRPPRDRGGERERRGEVAVIDAVVLGEDDEVEAEPIGPCALLFVWRER